MVEPPITFPQFYEAAGSALTSWGIVEDQFCGLFSRLVLCAISGKGIGNPTGEGWFILGAVFYAGTNFRGKIELIDHIFRRLIFDEPLLAEWNAIKNKATRLYARRNVLAHGTVWGSEDAPIYMRYSIFDATKRNEMDYRRTCAATASF